jgi:hypothetical protein
MDNSDWPPHNLISSAAGCAGEPDDAAGCGQVVSELSLTDSGVAAGSSAGGAIADGPFDEATALVPPQTLREFERALRHLGFTRQQATSIARHGFAGTGRIDAGPPAAETPAESDRLRAATDRITRLLKDLS